MKSFKRLVNKIVKPTKPTEYEESWKNLFSQLTKKNNTEKHLYYQPLRKAAQDGNWDDAYAFFEKDADAVTAKITDKLETALHIAVGKGKSIDFLMKLINHMDMAEDELDKTDENGETALAVAARVGNIEAAKLLVEKQPKLPDIRSKAEKLPLHLAAEEGNKEMVYFLLTVTKDGISPRPDAGTSGKLLLETLIDSNLYGAALEVLHRQPALVTEPSQESNSPLMKLIAEQPLTFRSTCSLTCLQRLLYFCIPIKEENLSLSNGRVVETQVADDQAHRESIRRISKAEILRVFEDLYGEFWEAICRSVPFVKNVQEKKLMHYEAVKLVNYMCTEFKKKTIDQVEAIVKKPLLLAARHGIKEVVEEILDLHPRGIWFKDGESDILQMAVINRHVYIFSLIRNHLNEFKQLAEEYNGQDGNNILHLAGRLATLDRLKGTGAALQMQHELLWFKEVEKLVPASHKEMKNRNGKTPKMIFDKSHKSLLTEGKKWMKETATSCITIATLVATLVFLAAIILTVGGVTNNGCYPFGFYEKAFTVFALADSFSLLSSSFSLLMFRTILGSSYSYNDFDQFALPLRLNVGLITLFLSLYSMIIAFSAILYFAIGYGVINTIILVGILAFLSISASIFIWEFPSSVAAVFQSTYTKRLGLKTLPKMDEVCNWFNYLAQAWSF